MTQIAAKLASHINCLNWISRCGNVAFSRGTVFKAIYYRRIFRFIKSHFAMTCVFHCFQQGLIVAIGFTTLILWRHTSIFVSALAATLSCTFFNALLCLCVYCRKTGFAIDINILNSIVDLNYISGICYCWSVE